MTVNRRRQALWNAQREKEHGSRGRQRNIGFVKDSVQGGQCGNIWVNMASSKLQAGVGNRHHLRFTQHNIEAYTIRSNRARRKSGMRNGRRLRFLNREKADATVRTAFRSSEMEKITRAQPKSCRCPFAFAAMCLRPSLVVFYMK